MTEEREHRSLLAEELLLVLVSGIESIVDQSFLEILSNL